MATLSGNCLCGKVTFELDDDFQQFHFCHCVQCQKTTGSAHAANLFTTSDNIRWLSGSEFVKRYDVPGRSISKAFCTECGCGVPYLSGTGKSLVVPAGSLNEAPSMAVQDNIFCTERAKWHQAGVDAKPFDALPE